MRVSIELDRCENGIFIYEISIAEEEGEEEE